MCPLKIYSIWPQTDIRTHYCNAVPLVWSSLRLTPIISLVPRTFPALVFGTQKWRGKAWTHYYNCNFSELFGYYNYVTVFPVLIQRMWCL